MKSDIFIRKVNIKPVNGTFEVTGFWTAYDFSWNDDFRFKGESHEAWEIVMVKNGKVEVTEDDKIYTLEPNNIVLHAPMEFHRIASAEGTSPKLHVMSFTAQGTLPDELKNGVFTLSDEMRQEFCEIVMKVIDFIKGDSNTPNLGHLMALRLSAFLIKLSNQTERKREDMSPTALEYSRVVWVMTDGVKDNLTLEDIAERCGISVSYIKQLFAKYADMTPKAYYTTLRISYAARLLDKGCSIAETAERMNFSSPNYFSAFFKKHTGVIPSKYQYHDIE